MHFILSACLFLSRVLLQPRSQIWKLRCLESFHDTLEVTKRFQAASLKALNAKRSVPLSSGALKSLSGDYVQKRTLCKPLRHVGAASSDGLAGCALTAGAWIVCRLGLLSADIAAVRALVPLRDGKGLSPKVSPQATALGPWALGFLCGAAAVAAACAVLRRQGRL